MLNLFLFLSTCFVLGRAGSPQLTEEDFARAKTIDIKLDHVDLYNGAGGPVSPPPHKQTNMTRGVWAIWPQGIIPYVVDVAFNDVDRAMIANSISYLEEVHKFKMSRTEIIYHCLRTHA